jgi:hypothetical protein
VKAIARGRFSAAAPIDAVLETEIERAPDA